MPIERLTTAELIAKVREFAGAAQANAVTAAATEPEPAATPEQYLRACGFGRRDAQATFEGVPADIRGGLRFYCEQLTWHMERCYGLSLTGQYGAGKTCGLALIGLAAQALDLEPWREVWYARVGDLSEALDCFEEQRSASAQDNVHGATKARLLLLDDLGSERESAKAASSLFAIFERRRARQFVTCTASNLALEALIRERPWHERMVDRLLADNAELITKAVTQRKRATPAGRHREWEASQ